MSHLTESISLTHRLKNFFGLSVAVLVTVFSARLLVDIGVRIVFPFFTQFAAGLDLTVVAFSWLIFLRGIVGIAGPIFGVWADRWGRRKMMALGLLCQSVGVLGLALTHQWWTVAPVILFGLTVAAFAPAQQAYISDQVIYQKRGRALVAIEFAWAMTAIVILPIVGWLIDAYGWRFPLFILSTGSLIGAVLVWLYLPPAERHVAQVNLSWLEIRKLSLRPNVMACMVVSLLTLITATSFISVWGIWLAKDFGLTAAALGFIATSIGVAELSGAGLSSLFIDRLGKRRGSLGGFVLAAILFISLPLSQSNLAAAIALLTVMGLVLEFSIVSLLPLYSEQVPAARGTLFSLVFFGTAIGAAVGSPMTAMLWERFGLWGVCGMAAACILTAMGLIVKFIKD